MTALQKTATATLHNKLRAIDDAYTAETRYFLDFCEANGYDVMTGYKPYAEALADGFVRNGEKRTYSAAAFNKRIQACRNRIKYAFKYSPDFADTGKRLQLDEFLLEVKTIKKATNQVDADKVLSPDEVTRLINETEPIRLRLIMEFLSVTALRISEALSIKTADMKRNGKSYKILVTGKGKKQRTIHAPIPLVERILANFDSKTWLFQHGEKQYSRISITNMVKTAGLKVLGRDNLSAHVFRHTWATTQLKRGKSLKAVSEYLGHASTSITADIYQHDTLSAEDAMLDYDEPDAEDAALIADAVNKATRNIHAKSQQRT